MDPVECNNGHLNDPYPESGNCVVCGNFLPGNDKRFSKESRAAINPGITAKKRGLEKKSREVLESLGIKWSEAPKYLQMMSETAAKSGNMKDMEFLLQQVGELKARPKSSEEVESTIVEVHISDAVIKSLETLDEIS